MPFTYTEEDKWLREILNILRINGGFLHTIANYSGGGGGTVTSVGLTGSSIFTITGSPVTTSGNIDVQLTSQNQGLFLASPSGSSGTPSFRAITVSDIPSGANGFFKDGGNSFGHSAGLGTIDTNNLDLITNSVVRGTINTTGGFIWNGTILSNDYSNTSSQNNARLQLGSTGALITGNKANSDVIATIQNLNSSSTGALLQVIDQANIRFAINKDGSISAATNTLVVNTNGSIGSSAGMSLLGTTVVSNTALNIAAAGIGNTTGAAYGINDQRQFTPLSGTGTFNSYAFTGTINQTGGANGITRGIYINPILTSASKWRAIEATGDCVLIGKVGIGIVPVATLHVAGSFTGNPGTASMMFQAGTLLTTPEIGAVEYDSTNLFITNSSTIRYILAKTLTTTASLTFGSIGTGASTSLTVSLTGAALGDVVSIGVPNSAMSSTTVIFMGWVSATDTISIRAANIDSINPITVAIGTYRVSIIKY